MSDIKRLQQQIESFQQRLKDLGTYLTNNSIQLDSLNKDLPVLVQGLADIAALRSREQPEAKDYMLCYRYPERFTEAEANKRIRQHDALSEYVVAFCPEVRHPTIEDARELMIHAYGDGFSSEQLHNKYFAAMLKLGYLLRVKP